MHSHLAWSQQQVSVQYFTPVPNLSIRALAAVSDTKAWFAGDRGIWGFTEDGGKSWRIDSIRVDKCFPDFRSIAVLNDSTALLLSAGSPAYLFRTDSKGLFWRLVHKNMHSDIFYDSMKFTDSKNGVAIGDPIDGCFQVITTNDAGMRWSQKECSTLPKAEKGEALFASSNSNIEIYGKQTWFATGGSRARVFNSADLGKKFEMYDTPIAQGGEMTGIYSLDFFNDSLGVIGGGDYFKSDPSITCLAITKNGGKTWTAMPSKVPFFGSCVQFKSAKTVLITGQSGTFSCSVDKETITELNNKSGEALKFNTLRIAPSGNVVWLAGKNGDIGRMTELE